MAKVNHAYQRQDAEALAALLSAWEASPESVPGRGVAAELVRVIRQIAQVRQRLDSISQGIEALQAGELYALYEKCNVGSQAGENLLAEMAASLSDRIGAARRELAALEAQAP